jgi:hypothetical protein
MLWCRSGWGRVFSDQDRDRDQGQGQGQGQGRLPGGRLFRLRRVTWKSTPSNQGCLLLVWPLVPRGSFTPVSLRGPAAIRHPWRGAALAASMPLGPRSETCVQPAPKSRLAVTEPFVYEDQKQINGFPGRTGFSREEAGVTTTNFTDYTRCFLVGPALAGKRPVHTPSMLILKTRLIDRSHALRGNAFPGALRRNPAANPFPFASTALSCYLYVRPVFRLMASLFSDFHFHYFPR